MHVLATTAQPGHFVSVPVTLCLCWLNPALLCSGFALFFVVFRGVIWSSSCRYGSRTAGAQHPPGYPATELPVEAGHEHLSCCLGAAGWPCQGKAARARTCIFNQREQKLAGVLLNIYRFSHLCFVFSTRWKWGWTRPTGNGPSAPYVVTSCTSAAVQLLSSPATSTPWL